MRHLPPLVVLLASPLWFSPGCDNHPTSSSNDVGSASGTAAVVAPEPHIQEGLLGTWQQILLNDAGRRFINEEEFREWDSKCTISSKTITWQRGVRREKVVLPYTLDTTKTPHWIDWRDERLKIMGIVQIEGDILRICIGDAGAGRPSDFDPAGSPSDVLLLFRRVESSGVEDPEGWPQHDMLIESSTTTAAFDVGAGHLGATRNADRTGSDQVKRICQSAPKPSQ